MATTTSPRKKAEAAVKSVEEAAGGEPGKLAPRNETVQQLKNRLRNEAEREVLNTHKAEVIKITEAKYTEHGLEYVRRLSDEEKAAKEIEQHLQKYPALRTQFAAAQDPDPLLAPGVTPSPRDEFGTAPISGELEQ